ncbi:MAG: hypothetical protein E7380_03370 [Clostridiales bacterium]|nr:hypothetical protein [Clostridiales bacterium]
MSVGVLKGEEKIAFELRSLYKKYGYQPYKMSKFEEYDLYVNNKEFLLGDGVITFNDTDGRLLALKPDVTLSIIKNSVATAGKRKVYYNENVYRISGETKQFKEIAQAGLECVGDIDEYDVFETVYLAAASLAAISDNFVLDLSHAGILSATLEEIGAGGDFDKAYLRLLSEKNRHEAAALCEKYALSCEEKERLLTLLSVQGEAGKALEKLRPVCQGKAKEAFARLERLCKLLGVTEYADKFRIDFSVVNNRNYYDDVVFKGFVDGIYEGVLSGGRYDLLLRRMGKDEGAIGFAVNLDLLEGFKETRHRKDVDILLLYDENTPTLQLVRAVNALVKKGNSVSAQKTADGIRYKELVDMTGDKL